MTLDDLNHLEIPVDVPEAHIRQFLNTDSAEDGSRFSAVFLTRKNKVFQARSPSTAAGRTRPRAPIVLSLPLPRIPKTWCFRE